MLIDDPPEVVPFAIDREKDFIEVLLVAGMRTSAAQPVRIGLPEFVTPLADRFGGYGYTASKEEFFDIAKAEREAMVQPDGVWRSRVTIRPLVRTVRVVEAAAPALASVFRPGSAAGLLL